MLRQCFGATSLLSMGVSNDTASTRMPGVVQFRHVLGHLTEIERHESSTDLVTHHAHRATCVDDEDGLHVVRIALMWSSRFQPKQRTALAVVTRATSSTVRPVNSATRCATKAV